MPVSKKRDVDRKSNQDESFDEVSIPTIRPVKASKGIANPRAKEDAISEDFALAINKDVIAKEEMMHALESSKTKNDATKTIKEDESSKAPTPATGMAKEVNTFKASTPAPTRAPALPLPSTDEKRCTGITRKQDVEIISLTHTSVTTDGVRGVVSTKGDAESEVNISTLATSISASHIRGVDTITKLSES